MKFDFTDKASYLAWRQQWRADYKALTQEIRGMKRCRKVYLNHYQRGMTPQGPVQELVSREPNPLHKPGLDWGLAARGAYATLLLERLKEAKALSWAMKQSAGKAAPQQAA